jgi:hypothetical protein
MRDGLILAILYHSEADESQLTNTFVNWLLSTGLEK